jgi:hypothetical protein
MTIVIASGEEAENQVKFLQLRMVAAEEKKLQLKPGAALISTVTNGITESTDMKAATLNTGTAGIMATMVTPREVRATIMAARFGVA